MPCLGVAFIAVVVGATAAVLKAWNSAGIKLGETTYFRVVCTAAVVELPWYRSFADLVEPRIRAYLGRYLGDLKKFERLNLEWKRVCFAAPEVELLKRKLLFSKLPVTLAEDLECLIWSWSREYQRRYNWSFRVAAGRICRAVSLLSKRYSVLVKLENLRGIKRKNVPHLRRWSWIRLVKLVLGCTSKKVGVALVDPSYTSSKCPVCRGWLRRRTYRMLICANCERKWHRDVAAAVNIALAEPRRMLRTPRSP
ncbi:MAG: hypothetical protein DRJ37_01865 [Thermoprotei archaeon]|nr:MAG: hypothetical protein DRJ37_01865 [Thermoprotei archaeon]